MTAINKETPHRIGKPPICSELLGLPVFEMPNQKSDCLVIDDKKIARAYKTGAISEDLLLGMITTGHSKK